MVFFGIGNVNTSIFRHLKKCGDRYAIPMCRQTFIVLFVCITCLILGVLPTDTVKESPSCLLEFTCKSKPDFQPVVIAICNIYSLLFNKRKDTLYLGSGVFACVGVCRRCIACIAVRCVRNQDNVNNIDDVKDINKNNESSEIKNIEDKMMRLIRSMWIEMGLLMML